jgi:hypothetical protein
MIMGAKMWMRPLRNWGDTQAFFSKTRRQLTGHSHHCNMIQYQNFSLR